MTEWPPIELVDVKVRARRGQPCRVHPLFSRPISREWAVVFAEHARASTQTRWNDAGFALCRPDQVHDVHADLKRSCTATNAVFRRFLEHPDLHHYSPEWMEAEAASAARFDPFHDAYPGEFAFGEALAGEK